MAEQDGPCWIDQVVQHIAIPGEFEVNMKKLLANSTGHIIVDLDGQHMLVDTCAARSYYVEEYLGSE